ncbi:MAG: phosphoenolpyruvate carboxylase [Fervidicoccaceae archaeon]
MEPPRLMCTQHPDSTVKVSTAEEVDEAIVGHTLYGCDEIMVDFEGKLTPYAQPREVVTKALELELGVGERLIVTPRVPSPTLEDVDRAFLSMEAAVMANYYSWKLAGVQATRWVILPMVEDVSQMLMVQRILDKKAKIVEEELGIDVGRVELLPLIEDATYHLKIDKMLREFYERIGLLPDEERWTRVFLGISDSAVRHGHVASSLALRMALASIRSMREEGYDVRPIVGSGSPPFRGAMNNPALVEREVEHYRGYFTVTVQSAARYDLPFDSYSTLKKILIESSRREPRPLQSSEEEIAQLANEASSLYRSRVARLIERVNQISSIIPGTRERVLWRTYGRTLRCDDGRVHWVPRAIVYTAAFYTAGLPPLLLDAAFLLRALRTEMADRVLIRELPGLFDELKFEAQLFHPGVAAKNFGEDVVREAEELLDHLGIRERAGGAYALLLEEARSEPHVIALGKLRKFLG